MGFFGAKGLIFIEIHVKYQCIHTLISAIIRKTLIREDFTMRKNSSKYESLFQEIEQALPPSFSKRDLNQKVGEMVRKDTSIKATVENKKAGIKRLVTKRLKAIDYKVYGNIQLRKLYTFEDDIDGQDCAYGFASENRYFSNLSAIYFLGLTEQKPLNHYICYERHSRPASRFRYDEELAKIEFRKKARSSKRYIRYKETEIYFIEKQNLDMMGVFPMPIKRREQKIFSIKCTGLERTFLDSVIAPQYSGGTDAVISFFRDIDLDMKTLRETYEKLNPIYPYWQSIGYLFDVMGQEEKSDKWRGYFETVTLKNFFISREYRSDWVLDNKWKIYHPESMA